MTVDEVITKIRYRLADYTDESYSDDELIEYINDGIKDFSYTGCNQYADNITSGSGSEYTLSTTLTYTHVNVYGVNLGGSRLYFADRPETTKWNPSAGTPIGWGVWGDKLLLDTSTTLSASNNLEVSYTYIPDDISTVNNTFPLEKWSGAIVAFCVYRCLTEDRDTGLADKEYAEYLAVKQHAVDVYASSIMKGGF